MNAQSLLDAMDGIAIVLDRKLVIRALGMPNWSRFFVVGGAVPLPSEKAIGRPILDFFASEAVKEAFGTSFRDVLARRRHAVKIDYRCDSPTERRDMRLTVTPCRIADDADGLLYHSIALISTVRPAIGLFGARASSIDDESLLTICSICAKVAFPKGAPTSEREWIEPSEYYRRGGEEEIVLNHGFCQPCFERLMAKDAQQVA